MKSQRKYYQLAKRGACLLLALTLTVPMNVQATSNNGLPEEVQNYNEVEEVSAIVRLTNQNSEYVYREEQAVTIKTDLGTPDIAADGYDYWHYETIAALDPVQGLPASYEGGEIVWAGLSIFEDGRVLIDGHVTTAEVVTEQDYTAIVRLTNQNSEYVYREEQAVTIKTDLGTPDIAADGYDYWHYETIAALDPVQGLPASYEGGEIVWAGLSIFEDGRVLIDGHVTTAEVVTEQDYTAIVRLTNQNSEYVYREEQAVTIKTDLGTPDIAADGYDYWHYETIAALDPVQGLPASYEGGEIVWAGLSIFEDGRVLIDGHVTTAEVAELEERNTIIRLRKLDGTIEQETITTNLRTDIVDVSVGFHWLETFENEDAIEGLPTEFEGNQVLWRSFYILGNGTLLVDGNVTTEKVVAETEEVATEQDYTAIVRLTNQNSEYVYREEQAVTIKTDLGTPDIDSASYDYWHYETIAALDPVQGLPESYEGGEIVWAGLSIFEDGRVLIDGHVTTAEVVTEQDYTAIVRLTNQNSEYVYREEQAVTIKTDLGTPDIDSASYDYWHYETIAALDPVQGLPASYEGGEIVWAGLSIFEDGRVLIDGHVTTEEVVTEQDYTAIVRLTNQNSEYVYREEQAVTIKTDLGTPDIDSASYDYWHYETIAALDPVQGLPASYEGGEIVWAGLSIFEDGRVLIDGHVTTAEVAELEERNTIIRLRKLDGTIEQETITTNLRTDLVDVSVGFHWLETFENEDAIEGLPTEFEGNQVLWRSFYILGNGTLLVDGNVLDELAAE